jgi:hypothetical protein
MLRSAFNRLRARRESLPALVTFAPLLVRSARVPTRRSRDVPPPADVVLRVPTLAATAAAASRAQGSGATVVAVWPAYDAAFESWHREVIARDLLFQIEIVRGP